MFTLGVRPSAEGLYVLTGHLFQAICNPTYELIHEFHPVMSITDYQLY